MKRFVTILFILFLIPSTVVRAQEPSIDKQGITPTKVEAVITAIEEITPVSKTMNQYRFLATPKNTETSISVNTADSLIYGLPTQLREGQYVTLQKLSTDPPVYFFDDIIRTRGLWGIAAVFTLLSLVVGLTRGFWSMIGLGLTLTILFGWIFPSILDGNDVISITVIGSIAILAINMAVGHGFRRESLLAFTSTVIGFLLVWVFAKIFSVWTALSGLGAEESSLILTDLPISMNVLHLYIAGVILGAVGVLDDIAISQTEIVSELIKTDPTMSVRKRFIGSMRIGRHHIASTINTLVLVYAGASMPVLLLFLHNSGDVASFLNSEIVTEEIVRTFAGTIALILTVPIASLIASYGCTANSLDNLHKDT